jgi:outer membrane immunogenic protein
VLGLNGELWIVMCSRLLHNWVVRGICSIPAAALLSIPSLSPIRAADLFTKAQSLQTPVGTPYFWTGLYGGLQLGGGWDRSTWRLFSQSGSGAFYGGQLGYNYQIGHYVLGPEADLAGTTLKADSLCVTFAGTNCETKLDYLASLRARAGIAVNRLLVFGDGGVAFGGFRFAETALLIQSWANEVHVGWTLGGGVEYAFSDHVIGGVEYNYYAFHTQTLGGGINPTTIPTRESLSTVMARLGYKF